MNKIIIIFCMTVIIVSCAYIQPAGGSKIQFPKDKYKDTLQVKNAEPVRYVKEKNEKKTINKQPVTTAGGNIKSFNLSSKANGTMIVIETSEEFGEKDVAVSISQDDFLNITVYKGKFDKYFPENIRSVGGIADISYYSFVSSAQITVRLKKKVASKTVIVKPDKIIVSLFENE